VITELEALEKESLADRISKDCLNTVNPTCVVEGVSQLACQLSALPAARAMNKKAMRRLFSMMVDAVSTDSAQSSRESDIQRSEQALNQMSDMLDIKVGPVGEQPEGGVECLLEEGSLAGNVAAQAMEVLRCLHELLPGAHHRDKLEASLVNIQGMTSEFTTQLEAATTGVMETAAKVKATQDQRTDWARQLAAREESLLAELDSQAQTVELCRRVDLELNQCTKERADRQQGWSTKLDALYEQWTQFQHEQGGWQIALECLRVGTELNQMLMDAAEASFVQLSESVKERAAGVEEHFMRSMNSCTVADLKCIQALQGKQERLKETIKSTQAVLDTEAPQTDAMHQIATTLTQEMISVAGRLESLFMSGEAHLKMVERFGGSTGSIGEQALTELRASIGLLLSKQNQ